MSRIAVESNTDSIMDQEFLEVLANDLAILAERALKGREVTMFGLDGCGQYGTDYHGHKYTIAFIDSGIYRHSAMDDPEGFISMYLPKYNAARQGHAVTDKNLAISLNALFAEHEIRADAWSWGSLEEQGDEFVTIRVNVLKFIDWT